MRPARFGKYLLLESISRGGMAEVYLGKSGSGDERAVAIKRILPLIAEDPDFQTMFVDEARISACLDHDNIGKVFEFGQCDSEYFLAMEYVAGRDVRAIRSRLVQSKEHMPVAMALCICSQLCRALDHAHRQTNADDISMEIVHRDVSPPNVLVAYDGQVKLIDFGIAWAASRLTRTRAGKLKGKFAYMSPEQVEGDALDRRSDIFSCGTMLFEMLTHRRPFRGENEIAVMHAIRKAECPPPSTINSDVPLAIDRIVAKALAQDRDERYQWASELESEIETYLDRADLEFGRADLAAWMKETFSDDFEDELQKQERLSTLRPEECAEVLDVAPLEEQHPARIVVAASPPSDTDADLPGREEDGVFLEKAREESGPCDTIAEGDAVTLGHSEITSSGTDTDAHGPAPEATGSEELLDIAGPVDAPHLGAEDELSGDPTQRSRAPKEMQAVDPTPLDLEPPVIPRSRPIYPEGDAIVGGSLEVEVDERELAHEPSVPRVAGPLAQNYGVPLEVLGSQQVINQTGPEPAFSRTQDVRLAGAITRLSIRLRETFGRMSSLQVTVIAALVTLVVVGLVAALIASVGDSKTEVSGPVGSVLIATTKPAGCTVVIDGQPKGLLTASASFKLHGLAVGRHLFSLKCAGYATYSSMVAIKAGEVTVVDVPLKKKKE